MAGKRIPHAARALARRSRDSTVLLAHALPCAEAPTPPPNVQDMTDDRRDHTPGGWLALVLRDIQFWVPVIVLAAGLLVLRWIS